MLLFRPKVDSPEVASSDLLKSIRPMTNDTLQHRSVKMHNLEIATIDTSISNIFCIKSSLQNVVDRYRLSLSL